MKRLAAVSLVLLSPGILLPAVALCCVYTMPECPAHEMTPSCHQQDTLRAADCCAKVEAVPAKASLSSAHFTLSAPASRFVQDTGFEQLEGPPAFHAAAVLAASPPVLNLRV